MHLSEWRVARWPAMTARAVAGRARVRRFIMQIVQRCLQGSERSGAIRWPVIALSVHTLSLRDANAEAATIRKWDIQTIVLSYVYDTLSSARRLLVCTGNRLP